MNIPSDDYPSEEQLVELFQQHKINWVQYVEHHSEDMKNDYREYCLDNDLDLDYKSEQSARQYLEHIENFFLYAR
ncbi:hypothetical protein [Hallella absiana]|jgi:hypothetical protein|uniref:hypothetical protein n=1 Tax=Hallella absiana TaxID=2925336 RepID=UPI0021CA9053|nr:hypothetical protein [Hallella absiana]